MRKWWRGEGVLMMWVAVAVRCRCMGDEDVFLGLIGRKDCYVVVFCSTG